MVYNTAMIARQTDAKLVRVALKRSRVVALLGPRQCGKTTLARQFVPTNSLNYFDLEDPQGLARLTEPDTALRPLRGLVVIDEIQRRPDLFPLLRVLADRRPLPARFLILGSASPDLLKQSSETLAGRLETVPLEGFRLADLGAAAQGRHWLQGGLPLSFTARTEAGSLIWRRQFLQTFLERDVPQLGITIPAMALRRFWNMIAHYHGQTWNARRTEPRPGGRPIHRPALPRPDERCVHAAPTAAVVREPGQAAGEGPQGLCPRQRSPARAAGHRQPARPRTASEGRRLLGGLCCRGSPQGDSPGRGLLLGYPSGAEIDLVLFKDGRRIGVECKRTDAPVLTPSMHIALTDLKLDELRVVYPGEKRYSLTTKVEVVPLAQLVRCDVGVKRVRASTQRWRTAAAHRREGVMLGLPRGGCLSGPRRA